jgi:hypothetical protein
LSYAKPSPLSPISAGPGSIFRLPLAAEPAGAGRSGANTPGSASWSVWSIVSLC